MTSPTRPVLGPGGPPEDCIGVDDWLDASKEGFADFWHRALRHHSQGIFEAERVFGRSILNSDGGLYGCLRPYYSPRGCRIGRPEDFAELVNGLLVAGSWPFDARNSLRTFPMINGAFLVADNIRRLKQYQVLG